jgi:hypothetical protein
MKRRTLLYNTGNDVFGHPYGPQTVDTLPSVPTETCAALSDVAPVEF